MSSSKNIIIIGPVFFGYIKAIADHLGVSHNVRAISDIPFTHPFFRALFKFYFFQILLIPGYYYFLYYKGFFKSDCSIIFISPSYVPSSFLKKISKNGCKTHLYLWDSLSNRKTLVPYLDHFDFVSSFDYLDVNRYDLNFLPLFSLFKGQMISKKNDTDLFFCGTFHGDRYVYIKRFLDCMKSFSNFNFKYYIFFPSRFLFTLLFLVFKVPYRLFFNINFRPLPFHILSDLYSNSKCVLDLPSSSQSGLTMRSFEALSAGCYLVTSNKFVFNQLPEDFHNRVIFLNLKNLNSSLLSQIKVLPTLPPLSSGQIYFLSLDRFCTSLIGVFK